jgi:hypothetical protein
VSAAVDSKDTGLDVSLSADRRVTLGKFKGQHLVDVREYYDAGGEKKPGAKGLALSVDQWQSFVDALPAIQAALQ